MDADEDPRTPLASRCLASWLTPMLMGAVGPLPTPTLAPPPAAYVVPPAEPPAPIVDSAPAVRQGGPKPHKGKPGPLVDEGVKGKGKAQAVPPPSQAEAHICSCSPGHSCPHCLPGLCPLCRPAWSSLSLKPLTLPHSLFSPRCRLIWLPCCARKHSRPNLFTPMLRCPLQGGHLKATWSFLGAQIPHKAPSSQLLTSLHPPSLSSFLCRVSPAH